MASQSHYTTEESHRKTRRLIVYDDVVDVLKAHDAGGVHDVRHNQVFLEEYDQVVVTVDNFGDGVAEALIRHHGFKLAQEGSDTLVYRNIY